MNDVEHNQVDACRRAGALPPKTGASLEHGERWQAFFVKSNDLPIEDDTVGNGQVAELGERLDEVEAAA